MPQSRKVERSTTGGTGAASADDRVDEGAPHGSEAIEADATKGLAKVRVAGSSPVVRSKVPGHRTFGRLRRPVRARPS
jgi:hypothetical protein